MQALMTTISWQSDVISHSDKGVSNNVNDQKTSYGIRFIC